MTQCSATARSTGKQCGRPAMRGGLVCQKHGGMAPQVRALAEVRAEVAKWVPGEAVDDPGQVLLQLVTQARQRVEMLSMALAEKVEAARQKLGDEFDLEGVLVRELWTTGEDGEARRLGDDIRGLVRLEAQERDRLASFSAKAVAAGLAERQVRLEEAQAELLAGWVGAAMTDARLALSELQKAAMVTVFRELVAASAEGVK